MVTAIVVAYLIGSIPFALLVARAAGTPDLRAAGSGNLGAANVMRTSGVGPGMLVAALDIAKGAASVALAARFSADAAAPAVAGLAAIVGHIYPVWLRFRGGKGVATTCGVFFVLVPAVVPPALAVFIATAWATRYISVASMLAAITLPAIVYAAAGATPATGAACLAAALVAFRHRSNVARLRTGTERRLTRSSPSSLRKHWLCELCVLCVKRVRDLGARA